MTAVVIGLALIGAPECVPHAPRLIWNVTPSAPVGLYWLEHEGSVHYGDLVLANAPKSIQRLAAARGYLPAGVPLVKRVAALAGDTVCTTGPSISIDGRIVATRLSADSRGRPLPTWEGCRTLGRRQVFLLMQGVPDSFDGRYFGPVEGNAIVGRLVPLWIR